VIRARFAAVDPFEAAENLYDQIESGAGDELVIAGQLIDSLVAIVNQLRAAVAAPPARPPPPPGNPAVWCGSGVNLIDLTVIDFLQSEVPALLGVLALFGIAEFRPETPAGAGRLPFERRTIHWDQLGRLVSDPLDQLQSAWHWNDGAGFDHAGTIRALEPFFRGVRLAARVEPPEPPHAAR